MRVRNRRFSERGVKDMNTIRGKLDSGKTAPSPQIDCWVPERDPSGIGIIIFPGGGYGGLAEHEGEGYARYLCSAGISCFVVKYRLAPQGYHHPAMLEDALAAICAEQGQPLNQQLTCQLPFDPN